MLRIAREGDAENPVQRYSIVVDKINKELSEKGIVR